MAQSAPSPQNRPREDGSPVQLKMLRTEADFRRQTRSLDRQERERYSSFVWNVLRMDLAPKVSLAHVTSLAGEGSLDPRHEGKLNESLDFYSRKDRERVLPVLRFYAAFVLQQARQETQLGRQLFLIFKAVDLLRMIVQYSPNSVSNEAETIVYGLFIDLGTQKPGRFARYMETEKEVHQFMRRLQVLPGDHRTRLALAESLARQTSLFDAFVQYQALMRMYPPMRAEADRRRGVLNFKIGQLFQNIADHAGAALQDGRKLKNFVDRYNRDLPERSAPLPPVTGPQPEVVMRAVKAIRGVACGYYVRALAVQALEPGVVLELATRLSKNYLEDGKFAEAADALANGSRAWKEMDVTLPVMKRRLEYLQTAAMAAGRGGRKEIRQWAEDSIVEVGKRVAALEDKQAEKDKRRAALLADEEEV